MYFKINLWEEQTFSFGDGISKLFDTLWTFEKIKSLCYNFGIISAILTSVVIFKSIHRPLHCG